MEAQRVCANCIRRPRDQGGGGGCPLKFAEAIDHRRGLRECAAFRIGDRRLTVTHVELPATLF
jgi:hypothetical protein